MAKGIMAFWTDIAPRAENDFNEWYNRQHLLERVDVPGFRNGARYQSVGGKPKYFTFYEADEVGTFQSRAYKRRLNSPTDWTRKVMPKMRDVTRTVCRLRHRESRGRGAFATTIRLSPADGRRRELETWLAKTALPAVAKERGIVGGQFWIADLEATGGGTTEQRELRGGTDNLVDWVVLVEGTDAKQVRAACAKHLSVAKLRSHGAAAGARSGLYRLMYTLSD